MKKVRLLIFLVPALVLIACGNNPQSQGPAEEKTAGAEDVTQMTAAPSGNDTAVPVISGKVAETIDAGIYTYVLLDDGTGKQIWAAIPATNLEVGEEVSLRGGDMVMENFYSKTLNRTFEKLIFTTGVLHKDGMAGTGAGNIADGTPDPVETSVSGGSAVNVVPPVDGLNVEKASGLNGYRVGELFEQAVALEKKTVAVKGLVVKISRNIMGKNWIHLQDGTGVPEKNTHDLVVTTADDAKEGDIVVVEGKVSVSKDFGFGYEYDVILEDAGVHIVVKPPIDGV